MCQDKFQYIYFYILLILNIINKINNTNKIISNNSNKIFQLNPTYTKICSSKKFNK